MFRKFLAETVTNGSIGLNRPKGYIPLGQRQKKAAASCTSCRFFRAAGVYFTSSNFSN